MHSSHDVHLTDAFDLAVRKRITFFLQLSKVCGDRAVSLTGEVLPKRRAEDDAIELIQTSSHPTISPKQVLSNSRGIVGHTCFEQAFH
jgi:hypothetical protein